MFKISWQWFTKGSIYCCLMALPGISLCADNVSGAGNGPPTGSCSVQFEQWANNYYHTFNPRQVPLAINAAIRCGTIDECVKGDTANAKSTCSISYFLAKVFAKNPTQISTLVRDIKFSSLTQRKVVYDGLWFSNTVEGDSYLNGLTRTAKGEELSLVKQIMQQPRPDILRDKITLDVVKRLWYSFLATGEVQYVRRIVSVFSWENPINVSSTFTKEQRDIVALILAVKEALRQYTQQDKRIFNICRNMLPSLDARAQLELKQLLIDSDDVYRSKIERERQLVGEE